MISLEFSTTAGEPLSVRDGRAVLENQYDGWRVRSSGTDASVAYLAVRGAQPRAISLEARRWRRIHDLSMRYTGEVTFYADETLTEPLVPCLVIEPANISVEAHEALCNDVAQSVHSIEVTTSASQIVTTGGRSRELDAIATAARSAIVCAERVAASFEEIAERPPRRLERRAMPIRAKSARGAAGAARAVRATHGDQLIVLPQLFETEDADALAYVRSLGWEVARDLEAAADALRDGARRDAERRRASALARRELGIAEIVDDVESGYSCTPEDAVDAALGLRMALGVDQPDLDAAARGELSNEVQLGSRLGDIVDAYRDYRSRAPLPASMRELIRDAAALALPPTWQLYERWLGLRLLRGLVEVGFRSATGVEDFMRGLFDLDERPHEELRVCLDRQTPSGHVTAELRSQPVFERPTGIRVPDFALELRRVDRAGVQVDSVVAVIDAKYHDYRQMGGQAALAVFERDLVEIGERRYRAELGVDVGCIVHPDRGTADWEDWDPVVEDDRRRAGDGAPAHSLLAVPITPDNVGPQITKLLRLLLGWRLGVPDVCWRCGADGVVLKPVRTAGVAYACPGCDAVWVRHRTACRHKQPLLKFGAESFHRVRPGAPWNAACPTCGGRL